jgi:hypothetical protein
MTKLYALLAAASIGFMGYQDWRGASMFGTRPQGEGLFGGKSSGMMRGPDGRLIRTHTYNHK